MKPNFSQDSVLNATIVFAAWLIVIVACVNPDLEAPTQVVRIAALVE